MMTRALVAVLLLGSADPTSMTICVETSLKYPGFRVRLSYQIGCETTGDYPSGETEKAAAADQKKRLKEMEPAFQRAYGFFVRGNHPFTRFRKFLSVDEAGPATAEIPWQDVQLSLFILPETPPIVRQKLAHDFVLALAFEPELSKTAPFAYPTRPESTLAELLSPHGTISGLVAHACRFPDIVRGWASKPIDPASMTSQHAYDHAHRLIKARALQRVLDRKPYGDDLLADARLLSRTESVRDLMWFSSGDQAAELKGVLDLLNDLPDAKACYEPLL